MEGDGLRAEDEFLVLFVFCREQLENRVLETALVSFCSTRVLAKIMRVEGQH